MIVLKISITVRFLDGSVMFLNGCFLTIPKDVAIVEFVSQKGKERKEKKLLCASENFMRLFIVFAKSFEILKRKFKTERRFSRLFRHER